MTSAEGTAEKSDESLSPSKQVLLQKLATLNTEFNTQIQTNQTRESVLNALQIRERILAIQAKLHGITSPEVIENLKWLANVTFRFRDLDRAEQYQQRLLDIITQKYGKEDYRAIDIKWELSTTSFLRGKTPEQVQQFHKGREQSEMGAQAYSIGDYGLAVEFFENATQLFLITVGNEHPQYASALNNMALSYHWMGEYAKAEPHFKQVLAIRKKALGERHPDYANSLNNLALLYEAMGEYARAEPLMLQDLAISKIILGEQHPNYAISLNNLALLYQSMEEYSKAKPLFLQAIAINKALLGEQHPDYATSLNNLALLYQSIGDHSQAEPLLQQALAIRKSVLGELHPDYATSLNNLALLYEAMGEYARAEPLFQQDLAISKTTLGEQHPDYAISLCNLAMLYEAMRKYNQAEPLYRQALKIQTANLQQLSVSQGEARALTYQNTLNDFQPLLACSRHIEAPEPAILYEAITESQGVISQVLIDRHELVLDNPAALEKQQELRQLQRELATLVLEVPQPEQIEARQQRLGQLNQQKEDLEQELARLSEPFRRELVVQKTGPANLQQELNEQQALVHLILGGDYNEDTKESIPLVDAFIVRRGSLDWIQIPHQDSVLELASTWRSALINGNSDTAYQLGAKLRKQLWQPIEAKLKGVKTIYFVLDGELSFLPFSALPGREPGTILLEDYQLATVSHPRELYRQLTEESGNPQSPSFLAMGAVDYDSKPQSATRELVAGTSSQRAPVVNRGVTLFWNKLPGTGQEVERLTELWTEDEREQILIGAQASESQLQQLLPGKDYIHLATHGFFADEKFRSFQGHNQEQDQLFALRQFSEDNELTRRGPTVTERNPLLLTGIVCAGANRPAATDEFGLPSGNDGIMTAQEIVSLDLRGTELVVLSACETGLGKVGGGEGVYGLQRAFQLAGARNVLGSLWSVDDAATAALMKLFYTKLWNEKLPPVEAIRQAQLEIYRNPELIEKLTGQRASLFDTEENLTETDEELTQLNPQEKLLRGDLKLNGNVPKQTLQRRTPARLWAAWTLQGSGM
ncbi:CHAT domain-containing protein [Rubinisphaera italica]|uniref:CHAT domain-containing protein n=1 Tax=Rubinisphaera italica TaxID=2527969 RepID=UPI0013EF2689|nr:CHAT domain-containing tetratricopeptide repeat protein [Rubinisphaera italica]